MLGEIIRERKTLHNFTFMWEKKEHAQQNRNRVIDTEENRQGQRRRGCTVDKSDERELMTPNHKGEITHPEPDIPEWEVKWASGSITTNKASGGDGIPVELFQILKDDTVKVMHSICQQIWKSQQWPQDWKRSVFIPIPEKGNAKECSNHSTISLISHASKVMFKILQAWLQQYMRHELSGVQDGFIKSRGTRDQIVIIR